MSSQNRAGSSIFLVFPRPTKKGLTGFSVNPFYPPPAADSTSKSSLDALRDKLKPQIFPYTENKRLIFQICEQFFIHYGKIAKLAFKETARKSMQLVWHLLCFPSFKS